MSITKSGTVRAEKNRVIREEGEETDRGSGEKLQFSLQHYKNVHQIDAPVTRKTSKARNAVLADLLSRHAVCWSWLPRCILSKARKDTHRQNVTSNCSSIWHLCLPGVIEESHETRSNALKKIYPSSKDLRVLLWAVNVAKLVSSHVVTGYMNLFQAVISSFECQA